MISRYSMFFEAENGWSRRRRRGLGRCPHGQAGATFRSRPQLGWERTTTPHFATSPMVKVSLGRSWVGKIKTKRSKNAYGQRCTDDGCTLFTRNERAADRSQLSQGPCTEAQGSSRQCLAMPRAPALYGSSVSANTSAPRQDGLCQRCSLQ
jgi:hypothetical protein